MTKSIWILVFSLGFFFGDWALAGTTYNFEAGQGKVTFLAIGHPSAIKIRGEGTGASGVLRENKDHEVSGTLSFDLTTLKTGISMRDEHMKKKYLKTDANPQAKLTLSKWKLAKPEGQTFAGKLKLNGKENEVEGQTSWSVAGDHTKIHAEFPVDLTKFGIDIPSFAGITVAQKVTVTLDADVKPSGENK